MDARSPADGLVRLGDAAVAVVGAEVDPGLGTSGTSAKDAVAEPGDAFGVWPRGDAAAVAAHPATSASEAASAAYGMRERNRG